MSVLVSLAHVPLVTKSLERWREASTGQAPCKTISEGDADLLALVVYYVLEYVEHRISPVALLDILQQITTRFRKGD